MVLVRTVALAARPVIVIGMHRSGTSLVSRLLEACGLFMGWRLAANHEAAFFNRLNSWLLSSAGGRWDTPRAIDYLLSDDAGRELAQEYLRFRISGISALSFLGPRRLARCRSLAAIDEPWGWKDPRTTITLPFWLDIFPEARVLHVVRNGIDVADSLHRRQTAGLALGRRRWRSLRALFRLVPKRGWFGTSPRVLDRREAFRLWEEYLEYARRFTECLGDDLLEVRFESLLASPREVLETLADFCGVAPRGPAVERLLLGIEPERSYSFRRDAALERLWTELRGTDWMRRYGYDTASPAPPDGPR